MSEVSEIGVAEFTDVIKVGGAVLGVKDDEGRPVQPPEINYEVFNSVGQEVSDDPNNIVLVSSFAIARGMIETGTSVRPAMKQIRKLQRLAIIGQPLVHGHWRDAIPKKTVGELLLTRGRLNDPVQAKKTLEITEELLGEGDVPVANEDDAASTDEIRFGSNDLLSATLAVAMQRSGRFGQVRLFMLTDVNGMYRDKQDPNTRIPVVDNVYRNTDFAQDSESELTIGGMRSKFEAAIMARYQGIPAYIYDPSDGPRSRAVAGEIGTYFPAWTPADSKTD